MPTQKSCPACALLNGIVHLQSTHMHRFTAYQGSFLNALLPSCPKYFKRHGRPSLKSDMCPGSCCLDLGCAADLGIRLLLPYFACPFARPLPPLLPTPWGAKLAIHGREFITLLFVQAAVVRSIGACAFGVSFGDWVPNFLLCCCCCPRKGPGGMLSAETLIIHPAFWVVFFCGVQKWSRKH